MARRSQLICRVVSWVVACVATGAVLVAQAATSDDAPAKARPQIGDKLAACTFTDIRFLPRSLSDFVSEKDPVQKRAFVLVFTNTTCPLVQQYLPRLKELNAEFRDQGVQFVAVNVGPDDSVLEIATQAVEHDMPFPFVKDIDGSCVAACGVERTAAAVLVDADYNIRYRGRIDNSYRLGGTSPGSHATELRDAIDCAARRRRNRRHRNARRWLPDHASRTPAKQAGEIIYAEHIAPTHRAELPSRAIAPARPRRFRSTATTTSPPTPR